MKKKLLISFSGGRTSAYMTWWLLNEWKERDEWDKVVVFANTGKEREETLEFVNQCDEVFGFETVWIEAVTNPKNNAGTTSKIVDFQSANRNGHPFEEVIKKYGLPNQNFPHCSRQLKGEAIKYFARQIGWSAHSYKTAIGIRHDEPKRLNWETAKKNSLIYPFATMKRVTKNDVNIFWGKQAFDLKLKSYEGNCDLCWKKSLRKLMTIAKDNPLIIAWWGEMEEKYGEFVPASRNQENVKLPIKMFRGNMSADEILEESNFPFKQAKDESKTTYKVQQYLGFEEYLDSNGGCVESCEAF